MRFDLIIVGAGLFGLTIAERAASQLGLKILIFEKRNHIGGNAYSYIDSQTGIEVHKYGSHIFHTSNEYIWNYVNKFTEFSKYEHTVYTVHMGQVYSMPINLLTINQFYKKSYNPLEAKQRITANNKINKKAKNLEEKSIANIGYDLYKAFIKGYTKKQWNIDPANLPSSTIKRLPIRFNYDNRYFNDKYQGIPKYGYSKWFKKMISHSNITIKLNSDFFAFQSSIDKNIPIIYTGQLDRYFKFIYGNLMWRSLYFEKERLPINDFQGTTVMNYADEDVPYTRIHEFKHFNLNRIYSQKSTIIFREYPKSVNKNSDPFYPVNSIQDREKLSAYRKLIVNENNVFFGGRLGTYQYLDMHMAIGSALNMFNNKLKFYFRKS